MTPPASEARGAYGVGIDGLGPLQAHELAAPEDWPRWTVRQEVGEDETAEGLTVWLDKALIEMSGAGVIRLDRLKRSIVFRTRMPLPPDAVLHPGLVPAAAVIAMWMFRVSVHASAVVVDGRVWGLLADREGGKSTTAAMLADRGCPLFADDMLVVEGAACFAGPASVDLREESAEVLGGRRLGRVGTRERWRKGLTVPFATAPLAGWIHLAWSADDSTSVTELGVGERIAVLEPQLSLPVEGEQLLDLAVKRMLRFTRPKSLGQAGASMDVLLRHLRPER